jgi:dihydrofolate reductase
MQVSLDGYVAGPKGELDWIFRNPDQEWMDSTIASLRENDTTLMGRVNYLEQARHWPTSKEPLAPIVNAHQKIVFSSSLEGVEWEHSRLATASPAQEIKQLKQQPGKHIGVTGGPTFVRSLLADALIDEMSLTIHPVALGQGIALFSEPFTMRLMATRAFANGAIVNTYRPAGDSAKETS